MQVGDIVRPNLFKLLILAILLALFVDAKSQDVPYLERPITIHATNATVAELFQIISTQADVVFSYSQPFNDNKTATINCDEKELEVVLRNLLKPLNSSFILKGKYIIIEDNASIPNTTQTIRGNVIDKVSQSPLTGAVILVIGSEPINGASSSENGLFKINQVAIGKQSIKASYIGYKDLIIPNISVNAGKETVLTIQLEEDIKQMNEVVVTANIEKNKPLNTMSIVSARTFSVEETQKFAAAFNDPARMATSFAGVVAVGSDGNNEISIRGNSPNGLLWRMEGVEIPNPNHFSSVGTSGGVISILSAQVLGNSDFSTGAFAAEYGNALSGVFDLKLRKGNNQKHEYTIEANLMGINLATEGPFAKNYEGSYLVNYRYSTLSLLADMGVPIGSANIRFQDLSFNISLPLRKLGTFGVFGFGGLSNTDIEAMNDSSLWKQDETFRYSAKSISNTGAIGITNSKLFNNNSYLKTAIVFSGTKNTEDDKKLQNDYTSFTKEYSNAFNQNKLTVSTTYTYKINAKINFRTGLIINQLWHNLNQMDKGDTTVLSTKIDNKGTTQTAQLFFQYNYKLNEKVTTNVGMHYLQLFLNNTMSLEPRASIRYDLDPKQNISFGYGLHSQLQSLGTYFAKMSAPDGNVYMPNINLELSKAHHFVLGYDKNINDFSHIKTELYYQYLYNIPISTNPANTYSTANLPYGYYTDKLANNGLGKNYGLELTYEHFMHNNLYYMITGSLFDSKYKASNNNWYNTMYNTNYALAATLGKDWNISRNKKNRVFGINLKSTYVGGNRYTPINLEASIAKKQSIADLRQTFELKNHDYFRLDIRLSLKRNYKKITTTLALDIQNITNQKNIGGQYYDITTNQLKYWYQGLMIPILSYRVEF